MAEKNYFDKYLKERYDDQVNWYDKKSMHNQKWAKRYQVLIIIFAALTPVTASLEFKWITIICSTLVAIMVGIAKYYKFDDLWQSYRTTCETLKKEKYMFDASIGPYETSNKKEALFVERVEVLISRENTMWTQIISKDKKEKGRP